MNICENFRCLRQILIVIIIWIFHISFILCDSKINHSFLFTERHRNMQLQLSKHNFSCQTK